MTTWFPAPAIDTIVGEVNAAAPARSKASDGVIGDSAHSSRVSDHNPNAAGAVRAVDITDDPTGGCDADTIAEQVRALGLAGHPAFGAGSYVIRNGRIASATADGVPWDWEPYSGSNGHYVHVHISVATPAAGYNSTAPMGLLEDTVNQSDIDKIAAEVVGKLAPIMRAADDAAAEAAATALLNRRVKVTRDGKSKNVRVEQLLRQAANSPYVIRDLFDKLEDELDDTPDK